MADTKRACLLARTLTHEVIATKFEVCFLLLYMELYVADFGVFKIEKSCCTQIRRILPDIYKGRYISTFADMEAKLWNFSQSIER